MCTFPQLKRANAAASWNFPLASASVASADAIETEDSNASLHFSRPCVGFCFFYAYVRAWSSAVSERHSGKKRSVESPRRFATRAKIKEIG
jgi:hypothetical protein